MTILNQNKLIDNPKRILCYCVFGCQDIWLAVKVAIVSYANFIMLLPSYRVRKEFNKVSVRD